MFEPAVRMRFLIISFIILNLGVGVVSGETITTAEASYVCQVDPVSIQVLVTSAPTETFATVYAKDKSGVPNCTATVLGNPTTTFDLNIEKDNFAECGITGIGDASDLAKLVVIAQHDAQIVQANDISFTVNCDFTSPRTQTVVLGDIQPCEPCDSQAEFYCSIGNCRCLSRSLRCNNSTEGCNVNPVTGEEPGCDKDAASGKYFVREYEAPDPAVDRFIRYRGLAYSVVQPNGVIADEEDINDLAQTARFTAAIPLIILNTSDCTQQETREFNTWYNTRRDRNSNCDYFKGMEDHLTPDCTEFRSTAPVNISAYFERISACKATVLSASLLFYLLALVCLCFEHCMF